MYNYEHVYRGTDNAYRLSKLYRDTKSGTFTQNISFKQLKQNTKKKKYSTDINTIIMTSDLFLENNQKKIFKYKGQCAAVIGNKNKHDWLEILPGNLWQTYECVSIMRKVT